MARKRYQKGQLWLEGDRWCGRWREDVVESGFRTRVRVQEEIGTRKEYPTQRLARRALDDRIAHVNALSYRPRPTAIFADFAQKWEREVLSQYGESTAVNYRTHLRKHLIPFFGRYSMKDVNSELVQHFVSSSAVSPKTTRNVCITLQSLWTTAKAWGYVAHDVMEGVVLPRNKRRQRLFASQQQIQRIVAAAQEPYRRFYGLAAETGLRPGELCGLTVDDLDLNAECCRCTRALGAGSWALRRQWIQFESLNCLPRRVHTCGSSSLLGNQMIAGCSSPLAMGHRGIRTWFSSGSSSRCYCGSVSGCRMAMACIFCVTATLP